jgi:sensor histidine kinase YesM
MHPILAQSRPLALYLGLWVLVSGLLILLLAGRTGLTWFQAGIIALPVASVYAFICLSAWYVARSLPIVTTGAAHILATGVIAAVFSSGVWFAVSRMWMSVLIRRGGLPESARAVGHESLIFGFGVVLYLLSLAVSYLLITFEETRAADRRALEVQVLAREAELRSLRSQIDPHFLFNCLHSISALTTADPPAARRMCLLLGDFLRETLALGGEARITIARELKLAAHFLDVEKIRFGERLAVEMTAAPSAEQCLVPPLLLQPIVENAVTHGVAHLLEGGTIRIAATRTPRRLAIVVENPYGTEATINATEQNGMWRVELSFPATFPRTTEQV